MNVLYACLVLASAAGPGQARAIEGSVGVLAVAPRPGPGPAAVELTAQLRDRMAERHPGVLDARALRERMTWPEPGASLVELDAAFERARAAYARGDYEGSVQMLRVIVSALEKLPDGEEAFAQWTRAMLRLARSEQSLGREEAARDAVERLVRAAPDLQLDPALHPPRIVSEVARARAALEREPSRTISVAASVAGADVYVDGRRAGAAPLDVTVRRGRYRVSAAQGALHVRPVLVDVRDADQQLFLDFTVPEALRPGAGPGVAVSGADRAAQVAATGAYLRLDVVVAVSLAEEGGAIHMVGSLYDVPHGVLVREGRVRLPNGSVPVGGTSALAEFLVTGDAASGLVDVPGERRAGLVDGLRAPVPANLLAPAAPPTPGAHARSRTLGWLAFGTGAVAVGLSAFGVLELRSAERSYDQARDVRASGGLSTSEGVARFNAHVLDGDDAKRMGTVSFVAAGATAVTAGILGYANYRRTGHFGPFRF